MLPIEGIYGFTGKYSFLSNFWPSTVEYEGFQYWSVENAYQAAKCVDEQSLYAMRCLQTPRQAKRLGKTVPIRSDWDEVKVPIMENLLRQKFTIYPNLSLKLYQTGDIYIEETNTWGDTFWGVCNGRGRNVLGNLLMKVREDIKTLYEPG
jgi:ribA/ribD-fused uncharacterized protein